MRILVLYRYYWPDTAPFGRVLESIAAGWAKHGHDVTVCSSQPGYNALSVEPRPRVEHHNGVKIFRTAGFHEHGKRGWVRALNHVLFIAQAFMHACSRRKYDVLVINSYPPIMSGLAARMATAWSGKPYIYNINDIHPESAKFAGYISGGWFYRLLRRLDTQSCRRARLLITMSKDMANTLQERKITTPEIRVFNVLLSSPDSEAEAPSEVRRNEDDFVVLFAGNIGRFQQLDKVVEAAHRLQEIEQIKFVFLGDGVEKEALRQKSASLLDRTVFFLPFAPPASAFEAMRIADAGIVSLREGVYRFAYPSKTITYLSAGCPVLAILEETSELAQDVVEHQLGVVCKQGDVAKLAQTIEEMYRERETWRQRRDSIREFANKRYCLTSYQDAWNDLVAEAAAKPK